MFGRQTHKESEGYWYLQELTFACCSTSFPELVIWINVLQSTPSVLITSTRMQKGSLCKIRGDRKPRVASSLPAWDRYSSRFCARLSCSSQSKQACYISTHRLAANESVPQGAIYITDILSLLCVQLWFKLPIVTNLCVLAMQATWREWPFHHFSPGWNSLAACFWHSRPLEDESDRVGDLVASQLPQLSE